MKSDRQKKGNDKQIKKSSMWAFGAFLISNIVVIIYLIIKLVKGDFVNVCRCILTLIMLEIPILVKKIFKIDIAELLEILIYLFIFGTQILGEVDSFYIRFPFWDSFLHMFSGFIIAGIGLSLVDLLNKKDKEVKLSAGFAVVMAVCFSMTAGIIWEMAEYGADTYLKLDMQKDKVVPFFRTVTLDPEQNNRPIFVGNIQETHIITDEGTTVIEDGYLDIGLHDTMEDIIVNFIGAVGFAVLGYLYMKDRDKYKFIANFMFQKQEKKI